MSYQGTSGLVKSFRAEGGAIGAGVAVIAGTAANQVKLPTAANQMPIGITKYAITEGEFGDVVIFGLVDCYLDGTTDIAWGDPLTVSGTDGRLEKSAITNGLHICARAYEVATEDGHLATVFFCPIGYLPTA